MQTFEVTARYTTGKVTTLPIQASSIEAARQKAIEQLQASKDTMRLVCIVPAQESFVKSFVAAARRARPSVFPSVRLRVKDAEFVFEQLAVMLDSGIRLPEALMEVARHAPSRCMRLAVLRLEDCVASGQSFSQALENMGMHLDMARKLSEVGEQTGQLAETLAKSAEYLKRRRETNAGLASALAYPAVVAVAAVGVAIYLVSSAIPKLSMFLHSMGRELPTMTQTLVELSVWLRRYGTTLVCVLIVAGIAGLLLRRWPPTRLYSDLLLTRLPIIGRLILTAENQRFSGGLAILLAAGVRLQDALQTLVGMQYNMHMKNSVAHILQQVCQGESFSDALGRKRVFVSPLSSLVAVGEKTGKLGQAVANAADHFDERLKRTLVNVTRLVEPVIIVTVGSFVAYVYIAFFMALMAASGNFK